MIRSLTVRPLDVAMKKPFGIAGGAQDVARNVLVTLTLDDGTVGLGEGAPFPAFNGETQALTLATAARVRLEGVALDDPSLEVRTREGCAASPSARCAIETAIVDARARKAGVPLHVHFGGREVSVVTDVTITTGTVDEARAEARAFRAFRTLKVKIGRDVAEDVARVLAVREVRPDARILVDANGGYAVDDAITFAREAASVNIELFEQPIAPGDWKALAHVRRSTGLRIAVDESVTDARDVDRARDHGAADAVNVKIMKSGIFEAVAIVRRTKELGLLPMIGGMVETRLAMGTSACIAAGLGGFAYVDLDTPLFLASDPFDGGYEQRGERIDLAAIGTGHGLTPRSPRA